MKHSNLFILTIMWILIPSILFPQGYQLDEKINEINQILREYPNKSSVFDIETTIVYSFELNYNELVVKEETSSSFDHQRKEYFIPFNEIKFQSILVSTDNEFINIKYSNYGENESYFKYYLYSSDGNSEGLEYGINIYLGDISSSKLDNLKGIINSLFTIISGEQHNYLDSQSANNNDYYKNDLEPEAYYDSYYEDDEDDEDNNSDYYSDYDYYSYDKNYTENSNNGYTEDSDIEYYNQDGIRIYDEENAYYYRTIGYDDDGKLVATDYLTGGIPHRKAQLSSRDPNNKNNDHMHGDCFWYYENGDVHYYAIYEDGLMVDNEYLEIDEQGAITKIFYDNFENNKNHWRLRNEINTSVDIKSGFLYVESKNNYKVPAIINYKIDQELDFIIEARFQLISGNENSGQGVIWGFKDWDNYFSFIISSDGYYEIVAFRDGLRFELSEKWVKSEYIVKNYGWNKLQLNKYGNETLFSINGHIVEKHDFYSFKGNYIGFFVGPNRKISCDNISINQKHGNINEDEYSDRRSNENTNGSDIRGTGSGIVLSNDGYIVTNYHVAGDANSLEVAFYKNNEREIYSAIYVVGDKEHDLAIIKIDDANFDGFWEIPYNLKIEDSDIGERVFTLGYPFASYMGAEIIFNEGTISSQSGLGGDDVHYQISVPVQPGNSGGPLFDLNGNLVGIVDSRTEQIGDRPAENIAYAIKTYYVRRLINKLPRRIEIPNSYSTKNIKTTDKIRILKEYVPIILIK